MLKCNEALIFTLFDLYRLQDQELSPKTVLQLRKALLQYFKTSSFVIENTGNNPNEHVSSAMVLNSDMDSNTLNLFVIPFKKKEENPRTQHESYISAVRKLQDQVASLFAHTQINVPQANYCWIYQVFAIVVLPHFLVDQLVLIIKRI
jgi:protein SMG9